MKPQTENEKPKGQRTAGESWHNQQTWSNMSGWQWWMTGIMMCVFVRVALVDLLSPTPKPCKHARQPRLSRRVERHLLRMTSLSRGPFQAKSGWLWACRPGASNRLPISTRWHLPMGKCLWSVRDQGENLIPPQCTCKKEDTYHIFHGQSPNDTWWKIQAKNRQDDQVSVAITCRASIEW